MKLAVIDMGNQDMGMYLHSSGAIQNSNLFGKQIGLFNNRNSQCFEIDPEEMVEFGTISPDGTIPFELPSNDAEEGFMTDKMLVIID